MKKYVLKFGLIAGIVVSLPFVVNMLGYDTLNFDNGELIGYTTMVVSFLMVYFGIRSYRDNVLGGNIKFGRAFRVGILISVVACACYVASWEVYFHNFAPDFIDKYSAAVTKKAQASGKPQAEIDAEAAKTQKFMELYKNPFVNIAITFLEPFPVALVITLVSAGVLSRRRGVGAAARASTA